MYETGCAQARVLNIHSCPAWLKTRLFVASAPENVTFSKWNFTQCYIECDYVEQLAMCPCSDIGGIFGL